MRIATESDLELVIDWVWKFESEAVGHEDIEAARETAINRILDGEIFLWEADHPVSMAAIGRPTPHGITISLVYTPPELRGRGYAISCVATLSQLQLDSGKSFCTLFTDITNPTSNEIYQRIGYKPVCDFNEYIF
jgi:predicted GNAT family acetyltransferase